MYGSEFTSFSFMGVSNSEMFLSEKDLNAMDLNFLAGPTLEIEEEEDHECQIASLQEDHDVFDKREDEQEQEGKKEKEEEEDKCRILETSLKIKLPSSLGELKVEEENHNDGFKTPTSSDHKIPPVLQCPPAPGKPKSRPLIPKRKLQPAVAAQAQQRIVLHDLSNEIEALFPPILLADLGKKIKKVRQENDAK